MPDHAFYLAGDLGGDPSATTPAVQDAQLDFYGVDLLFTDDVQVTPSGDYATVEGQQALRQAIYIRLMTSPGEYAIYPDFGCGLSEFVKKKATQSQLDTLRQRIIDQLSQEERIESVDEVTLQTIVSATGTGVNIRIRVTALGQQLPFNANVFAQ